MKPPAAAGAYCCALSEYSTLVKLVPAEAAGGVEQRTAAAPSTAASNSAATTTDVPGKAPPSASLR